MPALLLLWCACPGQLLSAPHLCLRVSVSCEPVQDSCECQVECHSVRARGRSSCRWRRDAPDFSARATMDSAPARGGASASTSTGAGSSKPKQPQQQAASMPGTSALPTARVKKIVKADRDITNTTSKEAIFLLSKATVSLVYSSLSIRLPCMYAETRPVSRTGVHDRQAGEPGVSAGQDGRQSQDGQVHGLGCACLCLLPA